MITTDLRDVKRFERDLGRFAKRGIPYAARNTANRTAFAARKLWLDEIQREFTLRNTWTTRTVLVTKATGNDPRMMQATLGSTQQYMADREDDQTKTKRGRVGLPIPTAAAAGQTAVKRTKLVRKGYRLGAIKLARAKVTGGRDRKNAVAIAMALKSGKRIAYLELRKRKRKGLFRIMGGKKKLKLRMLYDLSRPTAKVKARPTLHTAVEQVKAQVPSIQKAALLEQLQRNRVFGY